MRLFKCTKPFYCSSIERYIPLGAYVYRYDNVAKIAIHDAPKSDPFLNILLPDMEYNLPPEASWFYDDDLVSPFFEDLGIVPTEDIAGGGLNAGTGNGDPIDVELFTLTPTDIANKCIQLKVPVLTDHIIFIKVKGAPEQHNGVDYEYDPVTNRVCWDGYALDGQLVVGDEITVIHSA